MRNTVIENGKMEKIISKLKELSSRSNQIVLYNPNVVNVMKGIGRVIGIGPGIGGPDDPCGVAQEAEHHTGGGVFTGLDIPAQVKLTEVFDAVHHRYGEDGHHRHPHAHVKVKVPNGFLQLAQGRNRQKQTTNNGIHQ